MSESSTSELVELVKITQDDYDDGTQKIVLEFSNGKTVPQTWQWADLVHRDVDLQTLSAHELYTKAVDADVDVNVVYGIIQTCAKRVDGEEVAVALDVEQTEE